MQSKLSTAGEGPATMQGSGRPPRVVSLDVFRGLTLAVMIFVNELAEVKGLPWWTYHAPARVDVMTYVDMVFPAFLFILGMSIPLAIGSRLRRGDRAPQLVWYVALRSAALVVLGIVIANAAAGDPARMHGLGRFVWGLLAVGAAFLVWLDYPATQDRGTVRLQRALRLTGLGVLVVLAVVFRRTGKDGYAHWLSYDYPEILGLIGYTYFAGALCYLSTRRFRWAPAGWLLLFTVFNCLECAKIVHFRPPWYLWPFDNGALLLLTFAGMVLSTIYFLEPRWNSFAQKARPAVAFGVVAAVSAWLLSPLGISKIRATPTWALATVAACCFLYTLLYWVCDTKHWTAWTAPVRSAGANTLLTYLLPDLWFYLLGLLGVRWFETHLAYGWPGVVRALVFTALMLALSSALTKARVRLQL